MSARNDNNTNHPESDKSNITRKIEPNDYSSNLDTESSDDNTIIGGTKTAVAEVQRVKVLILLVVLFSMCGAIGVFFHTRLSEDRQFKKQYQDDSSKVLSSLLGSLESGLGALHTLSTSITTFAKGTNQTFPFVRMDNFAQQAAQTQQYTNAIFTSYAPLVKTSLREQWESFASSNNSIIRKVVDETTNFMSTYEQFYGPQPTEYNWSFTDKIYSIDENGRRYSSNISQPFYLPRFHTFPLVMKTTGPANFDLYSVSNMDPKTWNYMVATKQAVITRGIAARAVDGDCAFFSAFLQPGDNCAEPNNVWFYPVLNKVDYIDVKSNPNYEEEYEMKGVITSVVYWNQIIRNILPERSTGIVIVFDYESTREMFTYQIDGPSATYIGLGDRHDSKYDEFRLTATINALDSYRPGVSKYYGVPLSTEANESYKVHLYPSDDMKSRFTTYNPIIFAMSAAAFILFPFIAFLVYEKTVTRQKEEILSAATRSHAIVSSLFPANVRDQLYLNNDYTKTAKVKGASCDSKSNLLMGPPIAELYPETTVLFTDIVNFTQWSSVRDASQVFMLLESVYLGFDTIANRMKIFKVETVGDCYVAVAGLPTPRHNHSEVMVRFGKAILKKLRSVTADLAATLGPGTSTMQIRVGLNSGPTTAGVLRGNKGRFQLFGDTVNTAARMESSSLPGKILCSQKTANHLISLGRQHWLTERSILVDAKGKGMMQTFWVDFSNTGVEDYSVVSASSENDIMENTMFESCIHWMANVLENALRDIVLNRVTTDKDSSKTVLTVSKMFTNPRAEITETIVIPKPSQHSLSLDESCNELSGLVKDQIFEYVTIIAQLYRNNPFHNFHHASHVVMSTQKLLNRVVRPNESSVSATAYGIASDSLSQFAILFSALIHDVDHPGVSNAQLVKECAPVAIKYNNLSAAEQNSITLAWDLLMEDRFTDFRRQIMQTESEALLFRKLIVNSVMATDLFDADLKKLRETRWSTVFHSTDTLKSLHLDTDEDCNRRATIVIEHIIQASDVSHTMQHWHVYQEWNQRLFEEMYIGYKAGRVEKDPSEGWYDGELWFFDNYIIPLAKKLETCGVFGVSCGELLDYARDNRSEWAMKGRQIVKENVIRMERIKVETVTREWKETIGDDLDAVAVINNSSTSTFSF